MAPSQDDPRNPFEAFRRFADERTAALLTSLTGRPSNASKVSPPENSDPDEDRIPWILRGSSETQAIRRRYRQAQREIKAQREMEDRVSEQEAAAAERLDAHRDEQPRCPYRPADEETPQRGHIPFNPFIRERMDESENSSSWVGDDPDARYPLTWPPRYLFTSSYSPLHLENELRSQGPGQNWRHAFEDLIAIQSGMDMENHDSAPSKQCDGNWIGSRLHRDIFGAPRHESEHVHPFGETQASGADYLPQGISRQVRHLLRAQALNEQERELERETDEEYDEDEYEEPEDEAEIDRHILGLNGHHLFNTDFIQRLASQAFSELSRLEGHKSTTSTTMQATTDDDKQGKVPSIISTFTTTERTTLPDGSVRTKMVLKKRFADGREENTETTHTTRDLRPTVMAEQADALKKGKADEAETPKQKTKGWFWA